MTREYRRKSPRDYQQKILNEIAAALFEGKTKIVVQSLPGSGKTYTAAVLAYNEIKRGSPVLWIAAREELLNQAYDTISELTPDVGVIVANPRDPSMVGPKRMIQVASLQTLQARKLTIPAGLVIVDEMRHLTASNQWGTVLDAYADAVVVGLDGTPVNSTGSALRADVMITGPSVKELQALGVLVPAEIIYPTKLLKPKQIAQSPYNAWKQFANGKQALVFAQNSVAAKEHLAEFIAAGVTAAYISHETPNRDKILTAFKSGKLTILINQNILTEGYDHPSLPCAILARKFGSDELYMQTTSRVLRGAPGKTAALILDLAGNAFAFGSPEDERTYTLGGTVSKNGSKLQFRFCATCGVVLDSSGVGSICTDCTAMGVTGTPIAAPRVTGDRLVRFAGINKRAPMDRKTHYFKMMRELENRGKNIKAAFHVYKSIYNKPDGSPEEPPWSWLSEYMVSPERYKK